MNREDVEMHMRLLGIARYEDEHGDKESAKVIEWAHDKIDALLEENRKLIKRQEEQINDEQARADMHADINRRAAKALGKPTEGKGSSWHDIPEEIERLNQWKAHANEMYGKIENEFDDLRTDHKRQRKSRQEKGGIK